MALRVLLADESVTIKKVFQLALQDYGVEVLAVNAGVDVVPVAEKFKPDIVFADVLLQKRTGYEVAKDLSANDAFKDIPTVLIWSGFMELDDAKFKESTAKAHLEKPFDTNKLRDLVQSLVPKTKAQELSQYLEFPTMPEFEEGPPKEEATTSSGPLDLGPDTEPEEPVFEEMPFDSVPEAPEPTAIHAVPDPEQVAEEPQQEEEEWSMENFSAPPEVPVPAPEESNDDFVEMNLQVASPVPTEETVEPILEQEEESAWVSKTLTNFKLDKKKLEQKDAVTFEVPEEKIDPDTLINHQISADDHVEQPPAPPAAPVEDDFELELDVEAAAAAVQPTELNHKQVEAIVRAEAREILEKVIWEVVPEIASQVIEREIQKLLKEQDERDS